MPPSSVIAVLKLEDLGVSEIRKLADEQQVVSAKALGVLEILTFPVGALKGDVVERTHVRFISPNGGGNASIAEPSGRFWTIHKRLLSWTLASPDCCMVYS
jgi:hypothetical protein